MAPSEQVGQTDDQFIDARRVLPTPATADPVPAHTEESDILGL